MVIERVLKTVILVFVFALASPGCIAEAKEQIVFCPEDEGTRLREYLGVDETETLSMDLIGEIAQRNGYVIEKARYDNQPRHCDFDLLDIREKGLKLETVNVFLGPNKERTIGRNYLIIYDEDGRILYIEARHAYPPPTF
ncbi:MAG: hypothetical protein EP340_00770 [Alphaproteobacteria bacterium]|nr:MAG: hypothetical protein EP340_00770 [Alphaproteobacteria bacterium]